MSLIKQCKEITGLDVDNISSNELHKKLYDLWKQSHPDKFFGESEKIDAELKFKKIGNLLEKLKSHIEREELDNTLNNSTDIALYEQNKEAINNNHEIVLLGMKVLNLEQENQKLKIENRDLKNNKIKIENQKIEEKTKELIKLYNPSENKLSNLLFPIGSIALLTFLGNIEKIALAIGKYFPFSPYYFNSLLFVVFVITIINYLLKHRQYSNIKTQIAKVKTTGFIKKFALTLEDKPSITFKESEIFEFIKIELSSKGKLKQLTTPIVNDIAVEEIKNIFIYNLLQKHLISISESHKLDREFGVRKKYYSTYSSDLLSDDLPF